MKILKFSSKPKAISDSEAHQLTRLFLDGNTDADQERRLYDYYDQKSIADELECYREMFNWYAALGDSTVSQDRNHSRRGGMIAVAASLTALILIGAGLLAGRSANSNDMSPERIYAGSYIIRNGKKITDINVILPELRKADEYVDSTLSAYNQIGFNYVDPEKAMIAEALKNINDPDIRAMLMADIN